MGHGWRHCHSHRVPKARFLTFSDISLTTLCLSAPITPVAPHILTQSRQHVFGHLHRGALAAHLRSNVSRNSLSKTVYWRD